MSTAASSAAPVARSPGAGPLLEVASVGKSFGPVDALCAVSLHVAAGEVVALVGENGAGKSTLIKILAGMLAPDCGALRLDATPIALRGPLDARAHGIAVVHQDLHLCDNLSIAANLFLAREPQRLRSLGWIDRRRMEERARQALARVGLDRDPRRLVAELGPAARQLVEIARALDQDARLVVMDEPTASIDHHDAARLLRLIDELRAGGVAVLYVSHRLDEVTRIADRAVVLRDGRVAGELGPGEVNPPALVSLMMSGALATAREPGAVREWNRDRGGDGTAPLLRVRDLRVTARSPALGFVLHAGEILGVFGLVGAGRTELLETIFGLRRAAAGTVELSGLRARPRTRSAWRDFRSRRARASESSAAVRLRRASAPQGPAGAIAAGVALVPEDRKTHGLVVEMSIAENLAMVDLARRPLLARRARREEERRALSLCRRFDVRPPAPATTVDRLSGGNQQKVALAKWLTGLAPADPASSAAGGGSEDAGVATLVPRVLLLDEPTRGVDVGARAAIHRDLRELARAGLAILLSSAETEEVLALADRVLVLHRGALAGVLEGEELTEEALLRLAAGERGASA